MVIMVIRVIRVASVKSSKGILTHQGHISKVNENVHSVSQYVSEWLSSLLERLVTLTITMSPKRKFCYIHITHLPVLTPVFMLIPPTSTATATASSPAAKIPTPNIFTLDCSHFLVHFFPLLVQVLANNWLLGWEMFSSSVFGSHVNVHWDCGLGQSNGFVR